MLASRRRWALPVLAIFAEFVVAAIVVVIVQFLVRASDRTLSLTQTVAAVIVPAAAGAALVWRLVWRRVGTTAAAGSSMAAVADELAAVVSSQWERAAAERRLLYPAAIPVRWRWLASVAGPVSQAVDATAGGRRLSALPGVAPAVGDDLRSGGLRDLFGAYGGLASGRIIIVGRPGAGKTAAGILLLLDALSHRRRLGDTERAGVPVPVFLSLSGWDPHGQPFAAWLAGRLRRDYRFLDSGPHGPATVDRLIRDGDLAVFLDGLDEIADELRPVVLRALNDQVTSRLVLVSRSAELIATVRQGHLHRVAALELRPLSGDDAADYLTACQTQPLTAEWQRLVDRLRERPDAALTRALDTPLMLTLVRDSVTTPAEVDALAEADAGQTREQIEDVLLDRVLQSAYRPEPGQPEPPATPEQARRWLGHLAYRMDRDGTRDLAWWRVPRWTRTPFRVLATTLMVGTTATVGGAISGAPTFGLAAGTLSAMGAGLSFGLVFELARGLAGGRSEQLNRVQPSRFLVIGVPVAAVLSGAASGLVGDTEVGPAYAVFIGTVSGVVAGVGMGLAHAFGRTPVADDSPVDPVTSWRNDQRFVLAFGAGSGLVGGLAFGFAFGFSVPDPDSFRLGLVFGLPYGLLGGVALGVVASETWSASIAFLWLRRSGLAPARLLRFLEDARARGLLRTVGPVYQFRHARLQERLAAGFTGSVPTPRSEAWQRETASPGS